MLIFDFLIYYLTYWFSQRLKGSWSTPTETACYVMGLMTGGLLFSINEVFEIEGIKPFASQQLAKLLFVILVIGVTALYQFIYSTRDRYRLIAEDIPKKFNLKDDTGAVICIALVLLFALSPFIVTTILIHPTKH
jgi:hypothetical protein